MRRAGILNARRTISIPNSLVLVLGLEFVQGPAGIKQSHPTARHNPLLDRGAGRVHGVLDPVLALLHLDLGRTADADDGDAAGKLRQPLLQLLAVIVGGRLLDLRADLGNAALDVRLRARPIDDGGFFLGDQHPLGPTQHVCCPGKPIPSKRSYNSSGVRDRLRRRALRAQMPLTHVLPRPLFRHAANSSGRPQARTRSPKS